ncbi:MAG: acyl-CoA dehydrogenase family protein [Polyangiales bacterium]
MNFDLPESHREIQRMVRDLAARHVAPSARAWDEAGALPDEALDRVAELGLLAVRMPEAHGGAGLDLLALAVVVEELARQSGSLAAAVAAHDALGVAHLAAAGTDAQRERYLPAAASREGLVAWADAGVSAERTGGGWVLRGEAPRVALGASAARVVVVARTGAGATAFAVERGAAGLRVARRSNGLGLRACEASDLAFEACAVGDDARVGEAGGAADVAARVRAGHEVARAALAVGCGQGALDAAVSYAKDRKQFGQPIANFQAVQWMLADAKVELDAARLLTHRAAVAADGELAADAATALLFAGEAAARACSRALQVHGGYGYTKEFPVERHLRDAKACALGGAGDAARREAVAVRARAVSA